MTCLLVFLAKLADRPSTVWKLAWLIFCLVVLCLCGARPFPKIVSSVLLGVREPSTVPAPRTQWQHDEDDTGLLADVVLPIASWTMLTVTAATLIWH